MMKFILPLFLSILVSLLSTSYAEDHGSKAMEAMDHSSHMGGMGMPDAHEAADNHGIKLEFELMGTEDNLVTLNNFRGKHILLTFGFTQCAHICPVIAANMARALKINPDTNAAGIFISVDTERDTAAITHKYANSFHQRMVGLSGSYEQVNSTAENFKASYSVTKTQKHYTVQHTTSIFHIGPDGNLIDIYAMNTLPEVMSKAMK